MKMTWNSLPQKSDLTTDQVRDVFSRILHEMGLTVNSLKVGIKRAVVQAEVQFDDKRNVALNYDDYWLNTLAEDEVTAVLSHESCHIATIPDSRIVTFGPTPDLVAAFIEIFDEYLVHTEFARRFRGTRTFDAFSEYKTRDFWSYENILKGVREGLTNPARGLFSILNDAIYFPIVGDRRFVEWCDKNNLRKLPQFLDWLLHDFRLIENLKLERMKAMEIIALEGILSLSVSGQILLTSGDILFVDSAPEAEDALSQKTIELADIWRNRRTGAAVK